MDVSEPELFVKLKPSEDNPINECVNLDQLLEPCLQPTHSIASDLYTPAWICISELSLLFLYNIS